MGGSLKYVEDRNEVISEANDINDRSITTRLSSNVKPAVGHLFNTNKAERNVMELRTAEQD